MPKTHEGGKAFTRSPRNELFLRATTMFYGQDSFYEDSQVSDARCVELARDLAVNDWRWFSEFLAWLRSDGNVRTMPYILAVEGVRQRLNMKLVERDGVEQEVKFLPPEDVLTHRQVIDKVLQRPDEPGKLLDYHFTHYGKDVPKPIKRGVADSLVRMLNQRQALRYDKPGDTVRLGDVVEFCHPKAKNDVQGLLFEHLITNRHNREGYVPPAELDEISARWELNAMSVGQRHVFAEQVRKGDPDATKLFRKAMAGSWEWGKLWLGEK